MTEETRSPVLELLHECDPSLAPDVERVVSQPLGHFRTVTFGRLEPLDSQIRGPGLQYVIWVGYSPKYPFPGWTFDPVVRPLSYVAYDLAGLGEGSSRMLGSHAGGHIQGCVEVFCERRGIAHPGRHPLGGFVNKLPPAIPVDLARSINDLISLIWNVSKHKYRTGAPESVLSMPDALAAYFVARLLGTRLLSECGVIDDLERALQDATNDGRVYLRPDIPYR